MEADAVVKGAQILYNLMRDYTNAGEAREKIATIEHQADEIVHNIFEELNQTFITPIDSEDISGLALALDNVIDHINGAARRIHSYEVEYPTKAMIDFSEVLLKSTTELCAAVRELRDPKNAKSIEARCIEINRLENEGDIILNKGVVELFDNVTRGAKEMIKLKEIYEFIESAIDRCEDATNVISDIIMKNR